MTREELSELLDQLTTGIDSAALPILDALDRLEKEIAVRDARIADLVGENERLRVLAGRCVVWMNDCNYGEEVELHQLILDIQAIIGKEALR